MNEIRLRTAEIATALVLLAVIAGLFAMTFQLAPSPMRGYPGAAFMPRLILVYTAVFALVWLASRIVAARRPADPAASGTAPADERVPFETRAYIATIAAVGGFVLLLRFAGFEVAAFAVLLALLGPRLGNWFVAAAAAAATTLIFWAVFVLFLNVSIPLAVLPRFVSF